MKNLNCLSRDVWGHVTGWRGGETGAGDVRWMMVGETDGGWRDRRRAGKQMVDGEKNGRRSDSCRRKQMKKRKIVDDETDGVRQVRCR